MARTYGKAQDLIDFTRASSGTALRRVKYGAELVTNGAFDTDVSGWSGIGSISVVDQQLYWTNTNIGGAYTTVSTEAGKIYRFTFDLIAGSGSIRFSPRSGTLGGSQLASEGLSTGSHAFDVVADGSAIVVYIQNLTATGGDFYLDNVSVKEVIFDTSDGDLILFNHPANIPRIEYDADGNLLGLLVEEARTNVMLYSEALASPPWAISSLSVTVVANDKVAPDGNQTATKVSDASNFGGITATSNVGTTIASKSFTISVWVYADTTFTFDLRTRGTGSVQEPQNTTVSTVAGQWVRVSSTHTFTASADGSTMAVFLYTSEFLDVSNSNTIWFWGAQLEVGSFPTSYIPTSGSTATRSADVASIGVSEFGYRQDEGTVVAGFDMLAAQANATAVRFNGDGYAMQYVTGSEIVYRVNNLSGNIANLALTTATPSSFKVAGVWKDNDFAGVANGGTVFTDNLGDVQTFDTVHIGNNTASTGYLNGHIKSIKYYPRRLTNAQLQELTS